MSCGASTVKYLLFIFNFVFFISGIALLVIGALVKANEPEYSDLYDTNLYGVSVLLIVVGCVVTVIAFFGCCGAIRESRCMLYTFAGFLSLIFIVEFAGGIAAFVYRDELKDGIRIQMNKTMYEYNLKDKTEVTSNWDVMQKTSKCCGMNGYQDWSNLYNNKQIYSPVPYSCCTNKDKDKACSNGTRIDDIYTNGCLPVLEDEISSHAVIIGGVGIGVAFIQILGIVFACCLASILKN